MAIAPTGDTQAAFDPGKITELAKARSPEEIAKVLNAAIAVSKDQKGQLRRVAMSYLYRAMAQYKDKTTFDPEALHELAIAVKNTKKLLDINRHNVSSSDLKILGAFVESTLPCTHHLEDLIEDSEDAHNFIALASSLKEGQALRKKKNSNEFEIVQESQVNPKSLVSYTQFVDMGLESAKILMATLKQPKGLDIEKHINYFDDLGKALEILEPFSGSFERTITEQIKEIRKVLGNWKDVHHEIIADYEKEDDPTDAILYERMVQDLKEDTEKLENVKRIFGLFISVLDAAKDLDIESLERGSQSAAIDCLCENLEKFKSMSKETEKIQGIIQQLKDAKGIFHRLTHISNPNGEDYNKLMDEIEKRINSLGKDESLIIDESMLVPGGYIAEGGQRGHAMIYRVTSDGIEIINTGKGRPIIPGQPEKTAMIKYSSPPIPKEQRMKFLREVLKCMVKNSSIAEVQHAIHEHLDNYIDKDKYPEEPKVRLHRHQGKGSCYIQSYLAFVRKSLPQYTRKQFELFLTKELDEAARKAYASLDKRQAQKLGIDKKIHAIFEKAQQAIIRRTIRLKELEKLKAEMR